MTSKTRIALAIGSTLAASAALAAPANHNPFALTALDSGYQLAEADAKQKDGKCGEAKCGANKKAKATQTDKAKEASCGADKKAKDGSCGADKKMQEASCGANKKS